jgi:hypothetical protein
VNHITAVSIVLSGSGSHDTSLSWNLLVYNSRIFGQQWSTDLNWT